MQRRAALTGQAEAGGPGLRLQEPWTAESRSKSGTENSGEN